jgi:peptidoglycan L-alanyl-D-glutamate endopeptidase CwlK
MDCDVDIQKFAGAPFVIERPAGDSMLGNQAAKFLAKKGLRLEFGQAARVKNLAATDLKAILPSGAAVLDRQSASLSDPSAGTIVAMPSRVSPGQVQSISGQLMQLDGLKMLGHSLCGADRQEAATFAALVAMQKQFDDAALVHFADAQDTLNEVGLGSGETRYSLRELVARRQVVEAKIAFLGHGADQLAALAKNTVSANGIHLASLNPNLGDLGLSTADPAKESAEAFRGKFAPKEFGSASVGPSFLNSTLFNEKSRKEIQGVHPDLLSVVNRARELSPIAFEVVPDNGGMRDLAEQRRLTRAGKSRANLGRHTIGHAIDLVPTDSRGRPNFKDMKGFEAIRNAMEMAANELGVPIQWGGNWKKLVDKPHFELDRKVYPGPGEEHEAETVMTAFR